MLPLCQKIALGMFLGFVITGLMMVHPTIQAQQLFDQRPTTGNEVSFQLTNFGILGLDVRNNRAGGTWPRSAENPGAYLFGAGIWFGAIVDGDDGPEKRVNISYNPNSGLSWFAPGDITDGPAVDNTPEAISKNRLYFSNDYDANGQALDGTAPSWPLWNPGDQEVGPGTNNLGQYVGTIAERSVDAQGGLPVIVSDQDVVCRYKDTDVTLFEGGAVNARSFGLQVEQAVYSWSDPDRENFILIRYDLTNTSDEILNECQFAIAGDYDIGTFQQPADDDRMEFFLSDAARPMVAMWSDGGNEDAGFGYFGITMLQTPAVDENNFIRSDVDPADIHSQIGLTTVRDWAIQNDPRSHEDRYNFMSSHIRDGDTESKDGRLLFGSGAFNLRPGETARYIVGYVFASSVSGDPDGSDSDIANLVEEVNKATATWTNTVVSVHEQPVLAPFSVQLSPNPVNNILNIRAEVLPGAATVQNAIVQIDIVDQAGRLLLTQSLEVDAVTGLQQEIDVSSLNAGSYFCRLQMNEFTQSEAFVLLR